MGGEMKNCPHCGREGVVEKTLHGQPVMKWVQCNGCGASTSAFNQVEHAIAAWNRRSPDPELVEALERAKRFAESMRASGVNNTLMVMEPIERALSRIREGGNA